MKSKKTAYLYFDDKLDTAKGIKENLDGDSLDITIERELPWSNMIPYLLDHESTFDGLILDWKLDGEGDTKADFSSEALAQQCRRLQVDNINGRGFSKSFPIILCSSEVGFKKRHEKDTTSDDLFDGVFGKSDLENQEDFLLSLFKAYQTLSKKGLSVQDVLGLTKDEQKLINNSLINKIEEIKERQPHEMVLFLTKEVITPNGGLIDDNILASRLGVDIKSEGWGVLKEKFISFKYKGILNSDNRWWADLINEWWSDNFNGSILKFLTSSERIELLVDKFEDLKGKLLKPDLSNGASSDEFWTVCIATKKPLAEIDGFIIDRHLHYSWQEKEYICLDEAKDETRRSDLWDSLLPYEEQRLQAYFE